MDLSREIVWIWLGLTNVVTFLAFAADKWLAKRDNARLPEVWLVLLGAVGGWPGGWLAMRVCRHKTAKGSFLVKYALAAIPFAGLMWLVFGK